MTAPAIAGPPFAGPNRIVLKSRAARYEEGVVGTLPAGGMYPGMLLITDPSLQIIPHNVAGGLSERMFAIENPFQNWIGSTIATGAVQGETYPYILAEPGDELYAALAAGANVPLNAYLISNGDGTLTPLSGASQFLLFENAADSAPINNTAVETFFNVLYNVPANFLQTGDILHVHGQISIPSAVPTPTLTIKLYFGTTAIMTTIAATVLTGDICVFDADITIRGIGSGGSFNASGTYNIGTSGTATDRAFAIGTTPIDTTVQEPVKVSATWSAANVGNSCVLNELIVELNRSGGAQTIAKAREAINNSAGTSLIWGHVRVM